MAAVVEALAVVLLWVQWVEIHYLLGECQNYVELVVVYVKFSFYV